MKRLLLLLLLSTGPMTPAERQVDPTFLRRSLSAIQATDGYKPIFGAGDRDAKALKGISRIGELTVNSSAFEAETPDEQAWFVTEGSATLQYLGETKPLRKNDFFYVAPRLRHSVANRSKEPFRAIVMAFKIPAGADTRQPSKLVVANLADVKKQVVGNHPASTLYQLMIGDLKSTRDKIAAGRVLTSLYVMEFAPGGTNFPHHHEREEEVYILLDGHGDMVAGGGMDGIAGRHPSTPGDAFFFRLNCTVGFYNSNESPAHILAVRSLFPFSKE